MKVLEFGNIQGDSLIYTASNRSGASAGRYVAFAIGPDSTIDLCRVEGMALGLGQVLPLHVSGIPRVTPVRAPVNIASGETSQALAEQQPCDRLQLLAWECGEVPTLPGRRPPGLWPITRRTIAGDAGAALEIMPGLAWVPFAGRVRAKVQLCADAQAGGHTDATVSIYGITTRTHEQIQAERAQGVDSGQHVTLLGTVTFGSALGTAAVSYVGGTNDAEAFDALSFVYAGDGNGAHSLTFSGSVELFDAGGQ